MRFPRFIAIVLFSAVLPASAAEPAPKPAAKEAGPSMMMTAKPKTENAMMMSAKPKGEKGENAMKMAPAAKDGHNHPAVTAPATSGAK
ncbi:MAG TPA: hypothetical protein VJL82_03075 [Rhizomicrobium sp.]|nr:hypothetical protein [Rhizomicrobium sp.]